MNFQELKAIALANPKGKIVAHAPVIDSKDARNIGNWEGTYVYRDAKQDILNAVQRLNGVPEILLMSPKTYTRFIEALEADQDFSKFFQMGAYFGCPPYDTRWLSVSDEYEDDIVLVVAKPKDTLNASSVVYIDTR